MRRCTGEGTDRGTVSRRRFVRGVAAAGILGVAAPAGAQEGTTTTASPDTTEYELGAQVSAWVGQSPEAVVDEENPTLRLRAGRTYTISWVNLDGQQHQLQVLDGAGEAIAESDVVSTQGATGVVEFEATPEATAYRCSIHTSSMRGRIRVERRETRTTAGTATTDRTTASRTTANAGTERTTADAGATGGGTPAATDATTAADGVADTSNETPSASNATDAAATTDSLATTITEGDGTFGAGGASSRGQPGFGPIAGLAGVAGLLGLRRFVRRDD